MQTASDQNAELPYVELCAGIDLVVCASSVVQDLL